MWLEVTASRYQLHVTLEPKQIGVIFIEQTDTIDKLRGQQAFKKCHFNFQRKKKNFFLYYQYFKGEFLFFKLKTLLRQY